MTIRKFSALLLVFVVVIFQSGNTSQKSTERKADVGDWMQNAIDDQAAAIEKAKRNIVSGVKGWVIVEPTERECRYVDEAMCSMFSIGTDNLVDTMEKMETFCHDRNTYLVETTAWVIRKYTFHINIRVFMNIILNNMRKKIELYCAEDSLKQYYVDFMKQLTPINIKLNNIRYNFVDTLVSIQKSKVGLTKIPNFCCGYWRYQNETLEAIDSKNTELKSFIADMMASFFGDGITLVCFPYKMNYQAICSYYHGDHAEGQIRQSLLMNMVDAISKITYLIL